MLATGVPSMTLSQGERVLSALVPNGSDVAATLAKNEPGMPQPNESGSR